MDASYFGEFLTRQFPVAVLLVIVLGAAFMQFRKVLKEQSDISSKAIENQSLRFNQAVEEERTRLQEFWNEREIKVENAMGLVAKELKEVGRQSKQTNKILVYQSINNPALFKKSKSEKIQEILEILEEDRKDGV